MYGDVLPVEVTVGTAAFKEQLHTEVSNKSICKIKTDALANLKAQIPMQPEGEVSNKLALAEDAQAESKRSYATEKWQFIASHTGDPDNPRSIARFRENPKAWRVVSFDAFIPVTDLLPKALRGSLDAWKTELQGWLKQKKTSLGGAADVLPRTCVD